MLNNNQNQFKFRVPTIISRSTRKIASSEQHKKSIPKFDYSHNRGNVLTKCMNTELEIQKSNSDITTHNENKKFMETNNKIDKYRNNTSKFFPNSEDNEFVGKPSEYFLANKRPRIKLIKKPTEENFLCTNTTHIKHTSDVISNKDESDKRSLNNRKKNQNRSQFNSLVQTDISNYFPIKSKNKIVSKTNNENDKFVRSRRRSKTKVKDKVDRKLFSAYSNVSLKQFVKDMEDGNDMMIDTMENLRSVNNTLTKAQQTFEVILSEWKSCAKINQNISS